MRRPAHWTLLALVVTLLAWGCGNNGSSGSSASPGAFTSSGAPLPVVDMHLHTGEWDRIPVAAQNVLRDALPFPLNLAPGAAVNAILSADGIKGQLDDAGVDHGVLFAVYAPHSVGVATNELVRDRRDGHPDRFLALASVDVENWAQNAPARLVELERALRDYDMIGIKLAHPHMKLGLADPAIFPVYALAERLEVPVYVHIGNSPGPGVDNDRHNTDPFFFEDAIRRHPDCRFILGHVGYDFLGKTLGDFDTVIRFARQYPNVYLEASALGSAASDPTGANLVEVYRRFKAEGLVDRVLYGSDGPQRPGFLRDYLSRTVAAMDANGYSDAEKAGVLAENFQRVFQPALTRIGRYPLIGSGSGAAATSGAPSGPPAAGGAAGSGASGAASTGTP
jgi:predicted TIM-barrel fold metal-dependent hydrolase